MAARTQRLHYQTEGGETGSATIYWNGADCAEPRLRVSVDGDTGYIKLGSTDDASATALRVQLDSDGKIYAVLADAATEILIGRFASVALNVDISTLIEKEPDLSMALHFGNSPAISLDIAEAHLPERKS